MRLLHFFLLVTLLASCNAISTLTEFKKIKDKTATSPGGIVTKAISASKGRLLRIQSTVKEAINWDESDGDEDEGDTEERVIVPNLSSLKQTVSKSTTKLSAKISSVAMPIKLKLWTKQKKSLDDVKKLLGLETLSGNAFKAAPNFKYYDEYATGQIPRWAKKDLSPNDVKVILGIDHLSDFGIRGSPNFNYYDKYVENQIPVWVKKEASPSDIWVKLGLDKLPPQASFLDYSPSYKLFNKFMESDLESWAMNMVSRNDVLAKLGLENLHGNVLKQHRNYVWYERYVKSENSYRLRGWLKQDFSTYDVWAKLRLGAIRPTQRETSKEYKIYSSYVQNLDDIISNAQAYGHSVPNAISKRATPAEISAKIKIWVKTERNADFVKYALGLDKLEGNALTSHKNYQYFEQFLGR